MIFQFFLHLTLSSRCECFIARLFAVKPVATSTGLLASNASSDIRSCHLEYLAVVDSVARIFLLCQHLLCVSEPHFSVCSFLEVGFLVGFFWLFSTVLFAGVVIPYGRATMVAFDL